MGMIHPRLGLDQGRQLLRGHGHGVQILAVGSEKQAGGSEESFRVLPVEMEVEKLRIPDGEGVEKEYLSPELVWYRLRKEDRF